MEKWKPLQYPNLVANHYEISSYGRVKNVNTGKILAQNLLKSGYFSIRICNPSRNKKMHIIIHKAVAYTFIPNPQNLPEVNHKDGIKTNNNASNLEWCSSSYNQKHKYAMGLYNPEKTRGENNVQAKLTQKDVDNIRSNYIPYSREYGTRALGRKYGVSKTTIIRILQNKKWKQ